LPFGLNQSGPIIGEQRENIKPAPPALAIDRAYQARRSHCNAIDSAVLIKKINWTPSPTYQRESIPCCLIALNRSPTMNKSQTREVNKARAFMQVFNSTRDAAILGMVARTMGALIRSTRTDKARLELMREAEALGVSGHSDFIVTRWN
jgi:hypothetical protein